MSNGESSKEAKGLSLDLSRLNPRQRETYNSVLLSEQVEAAKNRCNVSLARRQEIAEGLLNGSIASKDESHTPPKQYDGVPDLEKFHQGGERSLAARPDIYELDD